MKNGQTAKTKRLPVLIAMAVFAMALLLVGPFSVKTVQAGSGTLSSPYTSVSEASAGLRKKMTARSTSVSFYIALPFSFDSNVAVSVLNEARDYNVAGNQGDYISNHLSYAASGYYLADFPDWDTVLWRCTYRFRFRSTAAMESALTKDLAAVRSSLGLSSKSDYAKVKAIYDYICGRVRYDSNAAARGESAVPEAWTAYGAFENRKAVCQGYALLFYRLCNDAGVRCRFVGGSGSGGSGWEDHAWNIVKIGNVWYNTDVTWDAGLKQAGRGYQYFLKTDASFSSDHKRDPEYQTAAFKNAHPMCSSNFKGPYKLTVSGGSGSGSYAGGTVVTIAADKKTDGRVFVKWSGTAVFAGGTNAKSASAKVKITKNTTLKAVYGYKDAKLANGSYRLILKSSSDKALAVKNNSRKAGAAITSAGKKAKSSLFQIKKAGSGYYYLYNRYTKKYLILKNGKPVQGSKSSSTGKWRITRADDGSYRLIHQSGKALTVKGGKVTVSADRNAVTQRFQICKG